MVARFTSEFWCSLARDEGKKVFLCMTYRIRGGHSMGNGANQLAYSLTVSLRAFSKMSTPSSISSALTVRGGMKRMVSCALQLQSVVNNAVIHRLQE